MRLACEGITEDCDGQPDVFGRGISGMGGGNAGGLLGRFVSLPPGGCGFAGPDSTLFGGQGSGGKLAQVACEVRGKVVHSGPC